MTSPDEGTVTFDRDRVIASLERRLGQMAGENARLEAVVAQLLADKNEAARNAELAQQER